MIHYNRLSFLEGVSESIKRQNISAGLWPELQAWVCIEKKKGRSDVKEISPCASAEFPPETEVMSCLSM